MKKLIFLSEKTNFLNAQKLTHLPFAKEISAARVIWNTTQHIMNPNGLTRDKEGFFFMKVLNATLPVFCADRHLV